MVDAERADAVSADASPRLREMARIALEAGSIAMRGLKRRDAGERRAKAPRDYVTDADVAVEAAVARGLAAAFPDVAISGEEGAADRAGGPGGLRFLIDPIDGTTNYAFGIPHFGLTIALFDADEILAGIVLDPSRGELFAAERGKGATLNGRPIGVATTDAVADTLIGAGLPIPGQVRSVSEETYHRALRRLMDETAGVRRLGSAALSIAYVACGRLDGFFEDGLSPHDYAAAALIVREAGGVTSGFRGGPVGSHGDVLVAGPALHPWLVEGFCA
ncbi:inositol monophosphatase family protein [Aureimonas leprariae]|uniref:Inositol-1-monophosphatase n=1 Tax=Plantimonas leprariae TaxID=2615207 RepID=A0A7V7PMM3_9HYPH|nr:inositol monophosphatase family protein [Aureimonas leprariae]KAB0678508.1 inositol monophosphatase [Aureimonas leprariae]